MGKKREPYFVLAAWHDWPEGGTFGTIVEANGYSSAERKCHREMALAEIDSVSADERMTWAEAYSNQDEWTILECWPVRDFIARHIEGLQSLADIARRIKGFDQQCRASEYTDTDIAWQLLDDAKQAALLFVKMYGAHINDRKQEQPE